MSHSNVFVPFPRAVRLVEKKAKITQLQVHDRNIREFIIEKEISKVIKETI